jgi:hypothetical protein
MSEFTTRYKMAKIRDEGSVEHLGDNGRSRKITPEGFFRNRTMDSAEQSDS